MQNFAMRVANNGVAGSAVVMLGVHNKLKFGNGPLYEGFVNGSVMTSAEYAVGYLQNDRKIQQVLKGDYLTLLDDLAFNSGVAVLVKATNVDKTLADLVGNVSFLPDVAKNVVITGVIGAGARTIAETIDAMPNLRNTPLKYVVHPTQLFIKRN